MKLDQIDRDAQDVDTRPPPTALAWTCGIAGFVVLGLLGLLIASVLSAEPQGFDGEVRIPTITQTEK